MHEHTFRYGLQRITVQTRQNPAGEWEPFRILINGSPLPRFTRKSFLDDSEAAQYGLAVAQQAIDNAPALVVPTKQEETADDLCKRLRKELSDLETRLKDEESKTPHDDGVIDALKREIADRELKIKLKCGKAGPVESRIARKGNERPPSRTDKLKPPTNPRSKW